MAAKNSKAGPSNSASGGRNDGKNDGNGGGKKAAEKLTFQGQHTTPYPKYRRGGLVFTRQMAEYSADSETLALLQADPHLDIKVGESGGGGGTGEA